MCCACQYDITTDRSGGATDSFDDGCAWYAENPSSCGDYDTPTFSANTMCGACFYEAGAVALTDLKAHHPMVNLGTTNKLGLFTLAGVKKIPLNLAECVNTDGNLRDAYGDSCTWYESFPDGCGSHDDYDFTSSEMCCACGGGNRTTEEEIRTTKPLNTCIDTNGDGLDRGQDTCSWYESYPGYCG